MGFTPCKTEQPLPCLELLEKEAQKDHLIFKAYWKHVSKEPAVKRCLLILDLKPFISHVKGEQSIGTGSSCERKETVDIDILVTSRNDDKRTCNLSE